MEDNFSNEVTASVNNSLKIILNHDKSSSLLVVSKILVSIGEVPPMLPIKIAGMALDAVVSTLYPEDKEDIKNNPVINMLSSLRGEIDNVKKLSEQIFATVKRAYHTSRIERIQIKYENMLKNPNEEIWAQAFHLDWSSFEDTLADFNRTNIEEFFQCVYETQCHENINALEESYNLFMTARLMYFFVLVKFYQKSSDDKIMSQRSVYIKSEINKCCEDLKKIDDTMDEVCEYFHALQALKRLSPPVQPVAVAHLPEIDGEGGSDEELYNTHWKWTGPLNRIQGDPEKPHYARFFNNLNQMTYILKIKKKRKCFSRMKFYIENGPARIDVGPDTYDLGCLTKDGTWKGGVLHVQKGNKIMYSEFTGGKNNDPIAGRNMFYNPAERMWIREFKFHLK